MKIGTLLIAFKGLADDENLNILFMKGDILKFTGPDEDNDLMFIVENGAMEGLELCFKPRTVVEHFEYFDESKQSGTFI